MRFELLVHEFLLCHVALLLILIVKKSSSSIIQAPVQPLSQSRILNFDDIETDGGWGEVPSKYGSLHFEGFYVFKPTDPEIERVISENDLNCATSRPNALYGTRFNFEDEPKLPFITAATLFSQDNKTTASTLEWAVDFPAGFHDMFEVDIKAFSGRKWSNLTKLEVWADFHDDNNGIVLDWEYCLDDLQIRFDLG
ncbi:hypothetical protein DV736_g5403, partial [Chaetothyriales sp. CBS 134916]